MAVAMELHLGVNGGHALARASGAPRARESVEGVSGVDEGARAHPNRSSSTSRGGGTHVGMVGHSTRAWQPCPGHASPIGAFPRARGGQRCGRRGRQFWASYGVNWTFGPKAKLKPMNCSTSFIKGTESLEKQING